MRTNSKLIEIFEDLANIYSMRKVQWKPQAYRIAAKSIEQLRVDVSQIYKKQGIKGLKKISGVGESIAKKIIEFIKTKKIKTYERLKGSLDHGVLQIIRVPGMGPRRAKKLYNKLGIKTVAQLERACKAGKVRKLEGFGKRAEQDILENIQVFKGHRGRMPLAIALKEARRILKILKRISGVKRVSEAGSARRRQTTIGDLDLVVSSSKPNKVIEKFVKLKDVKKIVARGGTKASIRLENNLQVDLRVVPDNEFGSALQYSTGNKAHNIALRKIAMKKGMKLNEYGLFKGRKRIAGKNENEIYRKLGVKIVKPEDRLGKGEI